MKGGLFSAFFCAFFSLTFIGHLIFRTLSIFDCDHFGQSTQWAGHGDISIWGLDLT
jgi:hypothetical protein